MFRKAQLAIEPTGSPVFSSWRYKAVSSGAVIAGGAFAIAALLLSWPELQRIKPSEAAVVPGEAGCRGSEASCPTLPAAAGRADTNAKAPSFLGYLEFDWDPDAPGGIPGFGPLPPSSRNLYARAAKERLSDPAGM